MYALYEDAGKFHAGRVMTEADSSMQIELDSGKRVKVMAALNIAHEHLAGGSVKPAETMAEAVDTSDAKRRIDDMGARIDAVLAPQQNLDL